MNGLCPHCKRELAIRNPSGTCDHLFYPEQCATCRSKVGMVSVLSGPRHSPIPWMYDPSAREIVASDGSTVAQELKAFRDDAIFMTHAASHFEELLAACKRARASLDLDVAAIKQLDKAIVRAENI